MYWYHLTVFFCISILLLFLLIFPFVFWFTFLFFRIILFPFFRLQFKGEIDPGSDDFWNKEVERKYGKERKSVSLELEEEKIVYTKEDANAILERLYRAGECTCIVIEEHHLDSLSLSCWRICPVCTIVLISSYLSLSLTVSFKHTCSLSHSFSFSHALSLSLSDTHKHILSHKHTASHTHTLSHTRTLSLTHALSQAKFHPTTS